jgi:hypothetical protein
MRVEKIIEGFVHGYHDKEKEQVLYMYAPVVKSAKPLAHLTIGKHEATLFGEIESAGMIKYLYVLAVYAPGANQPCLFVASEENALKSPGSGSHFLGVFSEAGHANHGASNDWADLAKFQNEAVRLASIYLSKVPPVQF